MTLVLCVVILGRGDQGCMCKGILAMAKRQNLTGSMANLPDGSIAKVSWFGIGISCLTGFYAHGGNGFVMFKMSSFKKLDL